MSETDLRTELEHMPKKLKTHCAEDSMFVRLLPQHYRIQTVCLILLSVAMH